MAAQNSTVENSPGDLLRAKALSAPSRVTILARLRRATSPLTAADLAEAMDMHHTAIREHLALLIDAGLVRGEPLPVIGRGRPRTGYVAVRKADAAEAYRTLAAMLVEAVKSGQSARDAGRAAGSAVPVSADGAVATVRAEAERLGFEPTVRVRGSLHEVVLTKCPFDELAVERPEIVCDLHLGIAEGVCAKAGGAVVEGIRLANPRKGGCRIMLRTT